MSKRKRGERSIRSIGNGKMEIEKYIIGKEGNVQLEIRRGPIRNGEMSIWK